MHFVAYARQCFLLLSNEACDTLTPPFNFPSQILYFLNSIKILGARYLFITFIQLSSSIRLDDSVSKCMSQVAAILCASIRTAKQSLEAVIYPLTTPCTNFFFFFKQKHKTSDTNKTKWEKCMENYWLVYLSWILKNVNNKDIETMLNISATAMIIQIVR